MKKGTEKGKDKQKIDYYDLINKNLFKFGLVHDYSGYQYTSLNLNVAKLRYRAKAWMCLDLHSKILNI